MREIKFRVWSKLDNRYIPYSINFPYEINEIFTLTNYLAFQQWTGLKDKKGKEIYEGDIIEFDKEHWTSESLNINEIKWNSITGGFNGLGWYCEWPRYCTILGNIFENPELLK